MCFADMMCEIGCLNDTTSSPLEFCACMPKCEYDELFSNESICINGVIAFGVPLVAISAMIVSVLA